MRAGLSAQQHRCKSHAAVRLSRRYLLRSRKRRRCPGIQCAKLFPAVERKGRSVACIASSGSLPCSATSAERWLVAAESCQAPTRVKIWEGMCRAYDTEISLMAASSPTRAAASFEPKVLNAVVRVGQSMTLSAMISSDCGMVRPNAFEVLPLIINSNLVGSSTGRSAGLVPLRILSMYAAARRVIRSRSGP